MLNRPAVIISGCRPFPLGDVEFLMLSNCWKIKRNVDVNVDRFELFFS